MHLIFSQLLSRESIFKLSLASNPKKSGISCGKYTSTHGSLVNEILRESPCVDLGQHDDRFANSISVE